MIRLVYTELKKLNHSVIWLAILILPIICAFMGTFNYTQNIGVLKAEWYSLWTQFTLFYCYLFFPSLIGIYCSYICRLEHLNHNWNLIMCMPTKISNIFISKLITVSILNLITQAIVGILYYIVGKAVGLNSPFPIEFIGWFIRGFIASVVICSFQLCISIIIRSFATPIGIALIGGILGLVMLSKGYQLIFPFSLLPYGMDTVNPIGHSFNLIDNLIFLLSSTIFIFIFCTFGIQYLKTKDVVA